MNIENLVKTLKPSNKQTINSCEITNIKDGISRTLFEENKIENIPVKYLYHKIHTIAIEKKDPIKVPILNIDVYDNKYEKENKFILYDFLNVYIPLLKETFHWINVKITNSNNKVEFEGKYLDIPFRLTIVEINTLYFNLQKETIEIQVKR